MPPHFLVSRERDSVFGPGGEGGAGEVVEVESAFAGAGVGADRIGVDLRFEI